MSRAKLSRPPLLRIQRIHELLRAGQPINRRIVAQAMEIGPKTIQRDLDFMRDQLGLPIRYEPKTHSYVYAGPVESAVLGTSSRTSTPASQDGPAAPAGQFLDEAASGHLHTICERHGVRAENVLCAIIGEALADAVCNSRLMDGIVRAARALAVDGRQAA